MKNPAQPALDGQTSAFWRWVSFEILCESLQRYVRTNSYIRTNGSLYISWYWSCGPLLYPCSPNILSYLHQSHKIGCLWGIGSLLQHSQSKLPMLIPFCKRLQKILTKLHSNLGKHPRIYDIIQEATEKNRCRLRLRFICGRVKRTPLSSPSCWLCQVFILLIATVPSIHPPCQAHIL